MEDKGDKKRLFLTVIVKKLFGMFAKKLVAHFVLNGWGIWRILKKLWITCLGITIQLRDQKEIWRTKTVNHQNKTNFDQKFIMEKAPWYLSRHI